MLCILQCVSWLWCSTLTGHSGSQCRLIPGAQASAARIATKKEKENRRSLQCAAPDFLSEFGGISNLHAAFFDESRTHSDPWTR
jgi:hypothetical protein